MADSNLNILIKAKNDASGPINQVKADLGGLSSTASKMSGLAAGVGVAAGVAAAAALAAAVVGAAAYAKDAVALASDLNETISKTNVIFGSSAEAILAWSRTAATALGMTQNEALNAASTFATFGKAAGISGVDLNTFSTELAQLAADLGSFYNTSPEQAITAIGAALRGESEPIRAYGVLLDDATLRQKALELGITNTIANALTPQQRALAATAVMFQQTSDAQGDFARTSDGLAAQQKILSASLTDLQATVGMSLLPTMAELTKTFNELLQTVMPGIVGFADGPLKTALAGMAVAFDPDTLRTGINEGIAGFESLANAAIDTYNNMLLSMDQFVTGFYKGINSMITGINSGIDGLNQFYRAMNQASAGAALLRGDISTAMNLSANVTQVPHIGQATRPNSYAVDNAADYLQLQRWQDTTRAADDFSDAIRGVGVSTGNTDNKILDAIASAQNLGQAMGGAAKGGMSAMEKKFNDIKSAAQSVVDSALSDIGGVDLSKILPRQDAPNENARRLGAIANEGLINQPWLDEFKAEAPGAWADLMLKVAEGTDVKTAAAQILKDFQDGLRPDLIDKGAAKERIKAIILGQQNAAALAEEIATELATEMGIPIQQALAAAGSALGVTTGAAGQAAAGAAGVEAATPPDMTGQGSAAGQTFMAGFQSVVTGTGLVVTMVSQMETAVLSWKTPGQNAGAMWGGGFMSTVESGMAPALITLLATLVTPGVLAAIQAGTSQTKPPDGGTP